jgi:hypothetical protein
MQVKIRLIPLDTMLLFDIIRREHQVTVVNLEQREKCAKRIQRWQRGIDAYFYELRN